MFVFYFSKGTEPCNPSLGLTPPILIPWAGYGTTTCSFEGASGITANWLPISDCSVYLVVTGLSKYYERLFMASYAPFCMLLIFSWMLS